MKSPCCATCKNAALIKPGFHIVVSLVPVARLGWPYGNTHAIIRNDQYNSSDTVVPIELRSISTTETTPMISYTTNGNCQMFHLKVSTCAISKKTDFLSLLFLYICRLFLDYILYYLPRSWKKLFSYICDCFLIVFYIVLLHGSFVKNAN